MKQILLLIAILISFLGMSQTNEIESVNSDFSTTRINIAVANYMFTGSVNDVDELSRFTVIGQTTFGSKGFNGLLETMGSSSSFSNDMMSYSDGIFAFAYGCQYATGGSVNIFITAAAGVSYYWGETTYSLFDSFESSTFSEWGFYYNAAVGLDLWVVDGFGFNVQVGLSRVPMVTIGINF